MAGEGMVAVVQGFRDAGLAVTILENGRSYTMVPNAGPQKTGTTRCDVGAQATDGRYATVYKVHHCKMTPTSPPVQLTEFPPQRAELCPGHGNFVVGGTGSGETSFVPVRSTCYRGGGMCWTDRGSVCSPRPSRDPDAFASSLRKYPVSPGSTEMLERLITYSQAKNYNRSPPRHYSPPPRYPDASSHTVTLDRSRSSRQGSCEFEHRCRHRTPEEYPTRDRMRYDDSYRRSTFCKNSDARFVRDVSRRLKDSIKSMSSYSYTQPACVDVNGHYDASASEMGEHTLHRNNPTSVNMEIQAATEMVSRDVATIPVKGPPTRTIAVPLSPTSSHSRPLVDHSRLHLDNIITRSVQTIMQALSWKSVQTSASSIELPSNEVKIVTKRSKSFSDFGTDSELKDEILEWLDDTTDPKLKALQKTVLKKLGNRLQRIAGLSSDRFKFDSEYGKYRDKEEKRVKDRVLNDYFKSRLLCCSICKSAECCRAESNERMVDVYAREFEDVIRDWINDISIKKRDFLHRPVKRDQIFSIFVNRLKHLFFNKAKYRDQLLKNEILDILEEVPIELYGCEKGMHLNTIADDLIQRLDSISGYREEGKRLEVIPKNLYLTESNLKSVVADAMVDIINKTKRKTKPNEMKLDVTQILTDSSPLYLTASNYSKEEITNLLNNVIQLPVDDAIDFASQLTGHLKDKLNDTHESLVKAQTETVLVLQDIQRHTKDTKNTNNNERNLLNRNDREGEAELDKYKNQLCKEIDSWLSSLHLDQDYIKEIRKDAINDLADDIVDRRKYLELNNNQVSDTDELEHLKYQIFKWINKLVDEENMETIEHAEDLMKRVKSIPIPEFTGVSEQMGPINCALRHRAFLDHSKSNRRNSDFLQNQMVTDQKQKVVFSAKTKSQSHLQEPKRLSGHGLHTSQQPGPSGYVASKSGVNSSAPAGKSPAANTSKPLMSSLRPPCCSGPQNPSSPSMKQLNAEFDAYLTNWVKEIPIPANTPEEEAIADKARLGIHHGIWKAIIRLKFQPPIFFNQFYYEDVLEEEIDGLLDLLPQTQELTDKRHMLKAQLIEKTTDVNELIKTVGSPATYKQQLAQQVASNLPRRTVNTDEEMINDPKKLYEDMMVQRIAEDFILATKFKDEDKIKYNAYRNKIIGTLQGYFDHIKRTSGKDIQDLDSEISINHIIGILQKVPLPSEDTIRQEADEILLGLEIDQWLNDLPIVKNDDEGEQLHRRRLRDVLTKKLHEMEKDVNIADCYGEPQFKHEISLFLEKVPLEKDESLNINFMVDELTNRMKNREKASGRRKSVAFQEHHQSLPSAPNPAVAPSCSQGQSIQGQQAAAKPIDYGQNFPFADIQNEPYRNNTIDGAEYHNFSAGGLACSSMINAQQQPQQRSPEMPNFRAEPQRWYSFDEEGGGKESSQSNVSELVYVPGRFHEQALGGQAGYTLHGSMLSDNQRYSLPGSLDSPNRATPGPPMGTLYDSQLNFIRGQPGQAPVMGDAAQLSRVVPQDADDNVRGTVQSFDPSAPPPPPEKNHGQPQVGSPSGHREAGPHIEFHSLGDVNPQMEVGSPRGMMVSYPRENISPRQNAPNREMSPLPYQQCPSNREAGPHIEFHSLTDVHPQVEFGSPRGMMAASPRQNVSNREMAPEPCQQCPSHRDNSPHVGARSFRDVNPQNPQIEIGTPRGMMVGSPRENVSPRQNVSNREMTAQPCQQYPSYKGASPHIGVHSFRDVNPHMDIGSPRGMMANSPRQNVSHKQNVSNREMADPCQYCPSRRESGSHREIQSVKGIGLPTGDISHREAGLSMQIEPSRGNVCCSPHRQIGSPRQGLLHVSKQNGLSVHEQDLQEQGHVGEHANQSIRTCAFASGNINVNQNTLGLKVEQNDYACPPCRSVAFDCLQNQNLPHPFEVNANTNEINGPTSCTRPSGEQVQNLMPPNPSAAGVSENYEPVWFSSPNRPISNAFPPNIKRIRQEQERMYRRAGAGAGSGTDDDEEPRVRCRCVERMKCPRSHAPRMCEDCAGSFPYYFPNFPMGYPFPYFYHP